MKRNTAMLWAVLTAMVVAGSPRDAARSSSLILDLGCSGGALAAEPEAIDFDLARQLMQRRRAGETLTAEEQAYLERARQEFQRRRPAEGQGPASGRDKAAAPATRESTGLVPLCDLGAGKYQGQVGGLYGDGHNEPPAGHRAAVLAQIKEIVPRDAQGKPTASGKIVLLSVGMSNTTMEFQSFKRQADADPRKAPQVLLVDGAQGGRIAGVWARGAEGLPPGMNPANRQNVDPWPVVDQRLKTAGVTARQVQVAWIKHANAQPSQYGDFPKHAEILTDHIIATLEKLHQRFPNLKVAYLSSRIYAGYATTGLNPEPYAYESAFAVRSVIERQIGGDPRLNFNPQKGAVRAPAAVWGPYLWTDGVRPRQTDKLVWLRADVAADGTHPSESGRAKVADLLLKFFQTDPLASPWYLGGKR